jgi:hypothetical protein
MLLANMLGPATRDAFSIFDDLCLFFNGERPQFLQLVPPQDHSSRADRERTHELFREVCLSPPLYPSETCMPTVVLKSLSCSEHSEHPLHANPASSPCSSIRSPSAPLSACPLRYPCCLPLAQAILLQARDGGILSLLIKLIRGENDAGEPRPGWMRVLDHMRVRLPSIPHL